jgi:hypothetical protein
MILTHFGINNQTFTNGGAAGTSGTGGYGAGKNQFIFHDAWNECGCIARKDKKFSMSLGAGLHYYMGLSINDGFLLLTIDAPILTGL